MTIIEWSQKTAVMTTISNKNECFWPKKKKETFKITQKIDEIQSRCVSSIYFIFFWCDF